MPLQRRRPRGQGQGRQGGVGEGADKDGGGAAGEGRRVQDDAQDGAGRAREGHAGGHCFKGNAAQYLQYYVSYFIKDAMVSTDIGNICSVSNSYLRFDSKGGQPSFFAAMSFGNCGYAFPAAIGAKVSCSWHHDFCTEKTITKKNTIRIILKCAK